MTLSRDLKVVGGLALIAFVLFTPVVYATHISSITGSVSGAAHTHPKGPVGDKGSFRFDLPITVSLSTSPGGKNAKGHFYDGIFMLNIPDASISISSASVGGGILVIDNNGAITVDITFDSNDHSFQGSLTGQAGQGSTFLGTVQIPGAGLTVHLEGTSGGFIVN